MTTTTKPKKQMTDCECGCGTKVQRRFAVGHDAKLGSRLVKAAMEGDRAAARELTRRNWGWKLDKAKAKAAKKAKRTDNGKVDSAKTE
jgi:hypothetical protein